MIEAHSFIDVAHRFGFGLFAGVPCSYLKPFINYVIDSETLRYVPAANEGDAVAIAAGAELGGLRSVAMFQNSGLGNAVNPLTSLTYTFQIPVLLIPTLRGEPGGAPDAPQHELMGQITTDLLDLMRIAWEYFPRTESEIEPALERAAEHMDRTRQPYALVMQSGSVAPVSLHSVSQARSPEECVVTPKSAEATRHEILAQLQAILDEGDLVVATTGYTGRELFALGDRDNQLYMVGSMGCASSLGLGLAIARPDRRIVVIDGDGAALMRLGALSTVGKERPANLVHVLLDNGMHESTGGQATVSGSVNFPVLAAASGYPHVDSVASPHDLAKVIKELPSSLSFVHVPTTPGVPHGLPRPSMTPADMAARFRGFIAAGRPQ